MIVRGGEDVAQMRAENKLWFERPPPPKWPFLTQISQIDHLTKKDVLGTWQDSTLFKHASRIFVAFHWGTLG